MNGLHPQLTANLPSPGRNVFILAVTTPNVVHTGNPVGSNSRTRRTRR